MLDRRTAADLGAQKRLPSFLVLDSRVLDEQKEAAEVREYVKQTRIEFVFPDGLAAVPLFEECRALCNLEDFDNMYDLTMQYLTGKTLVVNIINDDRGRTELGSLFIQDKMADLRRMDAIAEFPYIVNWLVEFIAGHLSKKFPLPAQASKPQAAEEAKKKRTRRADPKPS